MRRGARTTTAEATAVDLACSGTLEDAVALIDRLVDMRAADRRRLNRLPAAGWTVVFVTAADLHRPEQVVARIASALTR